MIHLRQYKQADFAQFSNLVSDPDVMQKVDGVLPPKIISNLFTMFIKNKDCLAWFIECSFTKKYIGHIALLDVVNEPISKEIIFYLVKDEWHKGYGTLAAKLAIENCFKQNICEKIIATVDIDHKFSRKILESIGMNIDYWDQEGDEKWPVYSISRS